MTLALAMLLTMSHVNAKDETTRHQTVNSGSASRGEDDAETSCDDTSCNSGTGCR